MKPISFLFIFTLFLSISLQGQQNKTAIPDKKVYTTTQISTAPEIDGILDDTVWNSVDWSGDFINWDPDDGKKPNQDSQFKIIYDDQNLYIAVRCFDKYPNKIVNRLARRDDNDGDWVKIQIDSYHDLRTSFVFSLSSASGKGDEFVSENGNNWDSSWNPVWFGKSNIDNKGWTAEFRIPFTQLRFGKKEAQVWGLQVMRRNFREEQSSTWQHIPKDLPGWVSYFGELHGLKNLQPKRQIEIQPYTVIQTETFEKEEGNPFATGNSSNVNIGIDGKIGITNDLTLDFTLNPDFGQVEADPSQISLDGYQIFFQEQRPFFVENKNIFDYKVSKIKTGGSFTTDNLFYSRRIGRSPQHYPETQANEFVDQPENTTILGAAKFSGKTKNGWSIGLMESVTAEEMATVDNQGTRREEIVEPLTNYLVGRLQKDFNNKNTYIGGIFTATNRQLNGTGINSLHKEAYTGGFDFNHQWKNRQYYIGGNLIFSKVLGTTDVIKATQESHLRYFQRPDANYLEVDANRTSLTGTGGNIKIGKSGGGRFRFQSGITFRSPELELNDIGFQRSADLIIHYTWLGYHINKPFGIFKNLKASYNHISAWDFGGFNNANYMSFSAIAQFKNNWEAGTGSFFSLMGRYSNSDLRGGPKLRNGNIINYRAFISTDRRNKVTFFLRTVNFWEVDNLSFHTISLTVKYQPSNALNISIRPNYSIDSQVLQYVKNVSFNNQTDYVNAQIVQKTFSMALRLNYTIKPNLTVQFYGQPFISKGNYSDFKYITNPLAKQASNRFSSYTSEQISFNSSTDIYSVDKNNNGTTDFEISNPDFSVIQFRSNLVVRWEYIPGSEIFLVWSQGINSTGDPSQELFSSLKDNIFDQTAHNIFLIKATYRFSL